MRSRAAERRQIHSLGREPQDTNEKLLRKPRSGDRNIAVIPAAHGTDSCLSPPPGASCLFVVLALGLRTAFGRRDAPSPASGQWPAIPDLGHVSLPPAGSRPKLRICRASGAQIRASLRRVFMEVVRRVPTYFRTRQVGGSSIEHPVSRSLEATPGFEPGDKGFAGPCLTTWPRRLES